jgi:hypothetical protein
MAWHVVSRRATAATHRARSGSAARTRCPKEVKITAPLRDRIRILSLTHDSNAARTCPARPARARPPRDVRATPSTGPARRSGPARVRTQARLPARPPTGPSRPASVSPPQLPAWHAGAARRNRGSDSDSVGPPDAGSRHPAHAPPGIRVGTVSESVRDSVGGLDCRACRYTAPRGRALSTSESPAGLCHPYRLVQTVTCRSESPAGPSRRQACPCTTRTDYRAVQTPRAGGPYHPEPTRTLSAEAPTAP